MITRVKQGVKWLLVWTALTVAVLVSVAAYTNVPTKPTPQDVKVFEEIGLHKPTVSLSFEQQITLIRKVQFEVFKRAPFGAGIPDYAFREPADLMRFGQGLCYDRSRTFDKVFIYLGMESRHVYLLYKEDKSFLAALFHRGQPSHAVTEVKTSKGWMFIDSNTAWVALTRQGEPVGADDVWRRLAEFDYAPPYLAAPWWAIRGMYSRKGQFYGAGVPFPELNWADFLGWVVGIKK
jgi:hypothetical protein